MNDTFEYAARPGNLGLSMLSFGGVTLLAAMLWTVAPGYVLLLFIPALLICGYQMIVTPVYGLRVTQRQWTILDGAEDIVIPSEEIAYLRIASRGAIRRASVVLTDGREVMVPVDLTAEPLELIREATERGVPVRSR